MHEGILECLESYLVPSSYLFQVRNSVSAYIVGQFSHDCKVFVPPETDECSPYPDFSSLT